MFAKKLSLTAVLAIAASMPALPSTIDLGYVSFDITNSPLAEVDIVNLTGPNSSLDSSFPLTTSVSLSALSLTVSFSSGSPETFGSASGYFKLNSDGLSFDGEDIFNNTSNPVTKVVLTGTFSPLSVTQYNGSTGTIGSAFSATITNGSSTLVDGNAALIAAAFTASGGSTVPEPSGFVFLVAGLAGLTIFRWKASAAKIARTCKGALLLLSICLVAAIPVWPSTAIKLAIDTSPSTGTAGSSDVWVTGSGFPSGPFTSVTIALAATCGGTAAAIAPYIREQSILTEDRFEFLVPASLATGLYYAAVSGVTSGGTAFSSGSSCSQITVTHTSAVLASCNPGSSMGILSYNPTGAASTPVTAYVPNGYWSGGATGIRVIPIEGSGAAGVVSTPETINSCSSNSLTGQTICIDNFTGVYIVSGTTVTNTLTSGATAYTSFSGGYCENCTVAVNDAAGTKGQAVIGMGYASAPGQSALQFLDLASDTFGAPVPMYYRTSEDILWDPFRNLVLSPDEFEDLYDLYQVSGSGTPGPSSVKEYGSASGVINTSYLDSAGEDCTTQIALGSIEVENGVYLLDLSQKSLTSGTPGTFTAPFNNVSIPVFAQFYYGTDGIAVAPGSTHLAITTGEFGGNQFGVLSLPATSGSGTPSLVDYAAAVLPSTPDGCGFTIGYDPHTTTAYTSPNNGKAYGVMADWAVGSPDYLAVIDLAALLKAPRISGIYPNGAGCAGCVNAVDPSYDLVANKVVTYVGTGNPTCSAVLKGPASPAVAKPVNSVPPIH